MELKSLARERHSHKTRWAVSLFLYAHIGLASSSGIQFIATEVPVPSAVEQRELQGLIAILKKTWG